MVGNSVCFAGHPIYNTRRGILSIFFGFSIGMFGKREEILPDVTNLHYRKNDQTYQDTVFNFGMYQDGLQNYFSKIL